MGVLFDGKLYHGPHMAAGEFGEMVIEAAGGMGSDEWQNRPGCMERLVSNGAICNYYSDLTGARRNANNTDTSARVRRIAELAVSGDAPARQTLEEAVRHLGIGISNLVWTLDADTVVIDSSITEAWTLVEPALRKHLPDGRELWVSRHLTLRPSAFGGEAALIGAATLPLSMIFSRSSPLPLTSQAAK